MSRWLFFPSPAATRTIVATTTGWDQYNPTITRSLGWSADATNGIGTWRLDLRNDVYGGFFYFNTTAERNTWLTTYQGQNLRITDSSANVYEFTGTFSSFDATNIRMSLSGWSGTLPTVSTSNATTIELYT
jgi:hypothetical protein